MSNKKPMIAVVGGGNGGFAFAGWLSLRGFSVILAEFEAFRHTIEPVLEQGTIRVTGVIEGEARVTVAASIADAVREADIVLGVIPAHVHGRFAQEMVATVRENTLLVLNPGRTGGALEVYRLLSEAGRPLPVAEAQTLLFACRKNAPDGIHIKGVKDKVAVGVMPAEKTDEALEPLRAVVPQFEAAEDVRTTSLGNIGAMFHPSLTILNASRIESGVPFEFYKEGVTPRVGTLLEALDRERIAVARAAGVRVPSAQEWLQLSYHLESAPLHVMMSTNPAYQGILAPTSLDVRYLHEDVPTGLVPLEAFGKFLGVETPLISSVIHVATNLMGIDYRRTGRTMGVMGLEGLSCESFRNYLRTGRRAELPPMNGG